MTRLTAGAALVAALLLLVRPAAAQTAATVEAGHRLADRYCANCHVIVRNGPGGWTDAPSFASIADRPNVSSAWLQGVITKEHVHMLNLPRDPADARTIAAYILSLRQK